MGSDPRKIKPITLHICQVIMDMDDRDQIALACAIHGFELVNSGQWLDIYPSTIRKHSEAVSLYLLSKAFVLFAGNDCFNVTRQELPAFLERHT